MDFSSITPIFSTDAAALKREGTKKDGVAQDFEALLIAQMLHSLRESDGWLGTGDDQSTDSAFGLAEQQLAEVLSRGGGFGLSKLLRSSMEAVNSKPSSAADSAQPSLLEQMSKPAR
jgi:flagellar protein FlgJ